MLKKNQQTSTLPTYQFIFSPDYWKSAAKQYTFLHIIAIVGVLIALDVAISTLFIPVGDNPVSYTHLDVYKRQEYGSKPP